MTTSIVSLQDARTYLRFTNPGQPSSDDLILQDLINAAGEVVNFHCGIVGPAQFDEYHSGGNSLIYLRNTPVVSVESVIESWGFVNYSLTEQASDTGPILQGNTGESSLAAATSLWAFSIDDYETGMITRRGPANAELCFAPGVRNIHVTYVAGRATVPASIRLAVLMLIEHWYQNALQRGVQTSGATLEFDEVYGARFSREDASAGITSWIGVPQRIIEMLSAHKRMPVIA